MVRASVSSASDRVMHPIGGTSRAQLLSALVRRLLHYDVTSRLGMSGASEVGGCGKDVMKVQLFASEPTCWNQGYARIAKAVCRGTTRGSGGN